MKEIETKPKLKKGFWKPEEDLILKKYVEIHGEGKWRTVSEKSGLKRGGRSCRLRWKNYLRPNIKRGEMSEDEKDLIIRLHKLLGNRWSLIAGRLPGRTDNEVKNYWNTHLNQRISGAKNVKKKPQSPSPLSLSGKGEEARNSASGSRNTDVENINSDAKSTIPRDCSPLFCDDESLDSILFLAFQICDDQALQEGIQPFLV